MSPDETVRPEGNRRVRVPAHVVHRAFESETVLLNLETGHYHGLNPTAARMFELLASTGGTDGAAQHVAEEFGVPLDDVTRDLDQLCDELAARGLIEIDTGAD